MEERFEIFVDDLFTIKQMKAQKQRLKNNLEDPKLNRKRRKFLKKMLDSYDLIIQNNYNNLLKKIDNITLEEVAQILKNTKNIEIKAFRYEFTKGNFIEMIQIINLIDGSYLYQGYNKNCLKNIKVLKMLDITENLKKTEVDPLELKEIDKIDLMYSLYDYEYTMNDIFDSFVLFLEKVIEL